MTSVVNRYYDPATDQFLSIDPDVADTNQPYVFTNDDPLNSTDPLGQCGGWFHIVCSAADAVGHVVNKYKVAIVLTAVTGALLIVTVGGASIAIPELGGLASELTGTEILETATAESTEIDFGKFAMTLAKVDATPFVAVGSIMAAPAALTAAAAVATYKAYVGESKTKTKKKK